MGTVEQIKLFDQFFRVITKLGGTAVFLIVILFALVQEELGLAITLTIGFLLSLAIVFFIRLVYFKPRPREEAYHTFLQKFTASAFPSWHTARIIFLTLTGIQLYPAPLNMFLLMLISLLVAYSRIYLRKHDWWDILGGVVVGVLTWWITLFI